MKKLKRLVGAYLLLPLPQNRLKPGADPTSHLSKTGPLPTGQIYCSHKFTCSGSWPSVLTISFSLSVQRTLWVSKHHKHRRGEASTSWLTSDTVQCVGCHQEGDRALRAPGHGTVGWWRELGKSAAGSAWLTLDLEELQGQHWTATGKTQALLLGGTQGGLNRGVLRILPHFPLFGSQGSGLVKSQLFTLQ